MSDYRCRYCGHRYPWRGGISFEAICELGRLVRAHRRTCAADADTRPEEKK